MIDLAATYKNITLADVLAFDALDEETKRIAVAGVILDQLIVRRIQEGAHPATPTAGEQVETITYELMLFQKKIATSDSRYAALGAIIAKMQELAEELDR